MTAWTWATANAQLGRYLNDADGTAWGTALRLDAINAALLAFAAHTAIACDVTVTGDNETFEFALPDNMLDEGEPFFVYDTQKCEWLEVTKFEPGTSWPANPGSTSNALRAVYQWPQGTLVFTETPGNGDEYTLYYFAYYNAITLETDAIPVPRWAREALLCYAAAYCLQPSAISADNIGQYDLEIDSGHPEHNPLARRRNELLKEYHQILARHDPQDRNPPYVRGRGV